MNENKFEGSMPNPAYDGVRGPDAPAALEDPTAAMVWEYADVTKDKSTTENGSLLSSMVENHESEGTGKQTTEQQQQREPKEIVIWQRLEKCGKGR